MSSTSYHASLEGGDFDAVMALLRDWLQTDEFKVKARMAGMEIFYERDGFTVFCQENFRGADRRPCYLMEGRIDEEPSAAADRLRPLLQLCQAKGLQFSLEYYALDEDGNELDEQRLS